MFTGCAGPVAGVGDVLAGGGVAGTDWGVAAGVWPVRAWPRAGDEPGASRNAPRPARARTITTNAVLRWGGVRSITAASTSGAAAGAARTGQPGLRLVHRCQRRHRGRSRPRRRPAEPAAQARIHRGLHGPA